MLGKPSKKSVKRVLAILIGLAVSGLAVEGGARLAFAPPEYINGMPLDPELGFRCPANREQRWVDEEGVHTFKLNSLGFRGKELPAPDEEAPAGTLRCLFLGDSFMMGHGVPEEELMPGSTESALAGLGVPAECYNAGVRGYGQYQELLLLRRHGADVRPDVVVLQMFTGNDFVDNTLELTGHTRFQGNYVRPFLVPDEAGRYSERYVHPVRSLLRRHLRSFALLEYGLLTRDGTRAILVKGPEATQLPAVERVRRGLLPQERLAVLRAPAPGSPWETGWERTEELVRRIRDEVEDLGARLIVIVLPHSYQVQIDSRFLMTELLLLSNGGESLHSLLDWNYPETRLRDFFRREGIEYLLALDPLREELARTTRSVYQHNAHLNGRGQRVAGRLVARAIAGQVDDADPAKRAPEGRPVDAIPQRASERGWIDLAREPSPELFDRAWLQWTPSRGDQPAGWVMPEKAMIAWPAREEPFVLRGWLPEHAPFPCSFRVRAAATTVGAAMVTDPGFFDIPVQLKLDPAEPLPIASVPLVVEGKKSFPFGSSDCAMILCGVGDPSAEDRSR